MDHSGVPLRQQNIPAGELDMPFAGRDISIHDHD
jgi:hypothetical protein